METTWQTGRGSKQQLPGAYWKTAQQAVSKDPSPLWDFFCRHLQGPRLEEKQEGQATTPQEQESLAPWLILKHLQCLRLGAAG